MQLHINTKHAKLKQNSTQIVSSIRVYVLQWVTRENLRQCEPYLVMCTISHEIARFRTFHVFLIDAQQFVRCAKMAQL